MGSSVGMHWPESLASKGFSFQSAASMTIGRFPALHRHLGGQPPARAGHLGAICSQYDDKVQVASGVLLWVLLALKSLPVKGFTFKVQPV